MFFWRRARWRLGLRRLGRRLGGWIRREGEGKDEGFAVTGFRERVFEKNRYNRSLPFPPQYGAPFPPFN